MSINLTKRTMLKITKSEERNYTKKLYLGAMLVVTPSLAFIYSATQLTSNLLNDDILDIFVNFEFDWDTLLSNIWTQALVVWILVDKLPLAIAGITILVLFVVIKQGIISSSLRHIQEITKYKETLEVK